MPEGRRLAVIGCGHVGTVTAAGFAELGHSVTGIDIDEGLVRGLNGLVIPFLEPGLQELFERHVVSGGLRFTTSYPDALEGADFVFLCVNTPETITGAADLRYVRKAVAQIAEAVSRSRSRPVIVNRSTSPIGTEETIDAILARSFAKAESRPIIAANPEFTREGSGVHDFFHPERIVVGADRPEDAERVAALYAGVDAPRVITDIRTAEMIKYVSNAFLATKVSFINEVARLCERLGVDVDVVAQAAALDPRIGGQYFRPGVGYGGSCLPKDVAALHHTGESVGLTMRLLSSVQDVNVSQRKHVVNAIRAILGPLEGLTIAAWGLTFKAGSEDLRESPAVDIIGLLRNEGAHVRVYDPSLREDGHYREGLVADEVCKSALDAARDADCVAILTDWPEFGAVDLPQLRAVMRGNLVYDGRNMLDRAAVEAAGFEYCGVGRAATGFKAANGRAARTGSDKGR
jgi:UDPglucose 6-dehydrogenase